MLPRKQRFCIRSTVVIKLHTAFSTLECSENHGNKSIEHKTLSVRLVLSFLYQLNFCNLDSQPTLIIGLEIKATQTEHHSDINGTASAETTEWVLCAMQVAVRPASVSRQPAHLLL